MCAAVGHTDWEHSRERTLAKQLGKPIKPTKRRTNQKHSENLLFFSGRVLTQLEHPLPVSVLPMSCTSPLFSNDD